MVPKSKKGDEDTDAFNVGWITLCLIKPLMVAPLYVLTVFGLCGMTEFLSLFAVTFLSFVLALMSGTSSYYNLYATHYKILVENGGVTESDIRGKTHLLHRGPRGRMLMYSGQRNLGFSSWYLGWAQ
eukprot:2764799-Rhodomonas_salina.1